MPETERNEPFCEVDTRIIDVSERLRRHQQRNTPDWHTIDDAAGPPIGFRAAIPPTALLPRHRPTVIVLDGATTDEMQALAPAGASPATDIVEDDDLDSDDLDSDDLELLDEEETADNLVTGPFMRRSLDWLDAQPVHWLRIAIAIGLAMAVPLLWAIVSLLLLPVA